MLCEQPSYRHSPSKRPAYHKKGDLSKLLVVGKISAPFDVNNISYAAFAGCERLKEAHFRHIRTVKDRAFDGCIILQTLDLGNRVEQLGKIFSKTVYYLIT